MTNRVRIKSSVTGECDLAISVWLIDPEDEENEIDSIYDTATVADAKLWCEANGYTVEVRKLEDIPLAERLDMFSNETVEARGGDGDDEDMLYEMARWIRTEQGGMDHEPVDEWLPEARAALYAQRLFQASRE